MLLRLARIPLPISASQWCMNGYKIWSTSFPEALFGMVSWYFIYWEGLYDELWKTCVTKIHILYYKNFLYIFQNSFSSEEETQCLTKTTFLLLGTGCNHKETKSIILSRRKFLYIFLRPFLVPLKSILYRRVLWTKFHLPKGQTKYQRTEGNLFSHPFT